MLRIEYWYGKYFVYKDDTVLEVFYSMEDAEDFRDDWSDQ